MSSEPNYDVVALGELLIDFTPAGRGKMGNASFEMNPGGAPPNCLVANARLGGKTAMLSMVGIDLFGDFLIDVLKKEKVDTRGIVRTNEASTTLAFVTLAESGERNFAFVRKPGADFFIEEKDIDYSMIDNCTIFHCGSLTMTDRPGSDTQRAVLRYAKEKGKLISYDPNYRPLLWRDEKSAKATMLEVLGHADFVKMSEEEMSLLLDIPASNVAEGADKLLAMGIRYVFITMGKHGAYYATGSESGVVAGYGVQAVDTTGCGDAFTGAMHYWLCHEPQKPIADAVRQANALSALVATRYGGISAMPARSEVEALLNRLP